MIFEITAEPMSSVEKFFLAFGLFTYLIGMGLTFQYIIRTSLLKLENFILGSP